MTGRGSCSYILLSQESPQKKSAGSLQLREVPVGIATWLTDRLWWSSFAWWFFSKGSCSKSPKQFRFRIVLGIIGIWLGHCFLFEDLKMLPRNMAEEARTTKYVEGKEIPKSLRDTSVD